MATTTAAATAAGVLIQDIGTVTEDGGRRPNDTGREPRTVH
jgi:hypothetical protein